MSKQALQLLIVSIVTLFSLIFMVAAVPAWPIDTVLLVLLFSTFQAVQFLPTRAPARGVRWQQFKTHAHQTRAFTREASVQNNDPLLI